MSGSPIQNDWIGRCRQTNLAHVGKVQARIPPGQAVHNVLVEVLIDQKRNHGVKPFAWLAPAVRPY